MPEPVVPGGNPRAADPDKPEAGIEAEIWAMKAEIQALRKRLDNFISAQSGGGLGRPSAEKSGPQE